MYYDYDIDNTAASMCEQHVTVAAGLGQWFPA